MATTIGYVQRLNIKSSMTCAFIGPAPTNVTALIVQPSSGDSPAVLAWKSCIVDGLTTAMATRQQVQASHGDTDSTITALMLGPG